MTIKSQEQVLRTIANGVTADRATILFEAHYLQIPSGDITHLKWVYDRVGSGSAEPYQTDIKIHPGKPVEIAPPGMEPGSFEMAIGHKTPKMAIQVDDILAEQQKLNRIRLYSNGALVAEILSDRLFFGVVPGKLTIECDRATTIAHVVCYPL